MEEQSSSSILLDKSTAAPFSFSQYCQKIKQHDCQFPTDLLQKTAHVYNKLHGLKKIEKYHRIDIESSTIETKRQSHQANCHVYKMYKKIDESALANLELILGIIDYYKKKS